MKNIKLLVIGLAVMLGFSACSESWLENELTGSTISQDDYDRLDVDASVRGLYSFLYRNSSSGHDGFGQKSIDIATDFLSGDMAMSANAYGWFASDAQFQGAGVSGGRNSFMWSYYYSIIMNANLVIRKLDAVAATAELTDEQKQFYAQALTMRGYAYFGLLNFYTPGRTDGTEGYMGGTGLDYRAVPIYNEFTFDSIKGVPIEQNLSTKRQLIAQVHNDLNNAISFFESVSEKPRSGAEKLYVNSDIARTFSAYTYMIEEKYDSAYNQAMRVINSPVDNYSIIPFDEVLTTGFTDVTNPSWMWGLDVNVENSTQLASFWGHMDVHTYSYAQAGAMKIIDNALYGSMPAYDVRKQWFDSKKYNPEYKFYDLARGTGLEVDRRWLNDLVYMRIEEVYLIAAEAAYRNNDLDAAKTQLKALVSERYSADLAEEGVPVPDIDAMDASAIESELEYNWRIELWGEGRSLMTFKRFGKPHMTGSSRVFMKNENIEATDYRILFRVPSGELSTNMEITYQ